MDDKQRSKIILQTSIIGIVANVMLASMKAIVGFLVNSIAVILDAINNLTDALSSVITIVGTKLAGKKPNKKHPLGYGRIEYLSAMIVSAIILYAGITALIESIKKAINPELADYSTISLILISVAVVVKILLGLFFRYKAKKVSSDALKSSGTDALFDAILSFSVLVCAIITLTTEVSLEAYVGILLSLFIIKASISMMVETVNDILGKRVEADLSKEIKSIICEEENVLGAYDLIVNNYGPNKDYASVHIEVPDSLDVATIDTMIRHIEKNVYQKTRIILTGVSVYSFNTKDEKAIKIRERVKEIVLGFEGVLGFHGFYLDSKNKDMRFDAVISFDVDAKDTVKNIKEKILEEFNDYSIIISPDIDASD